MPASTSRTPSSTFSGVSRLIRPSSSSSPQSPHVDPSGRCFHRCVTAISPSGHSTLRPAVSVACTDRLVYTPGRRVPRARPPGHRDLASSAQEGHHHDREPTRRLRRRTHPRAHRPLHHPAAQASAGPGGVGGRLRDRADGRGRGPDLPAAAHTRVRGVDDLPLPADGRPDARGRPRDDPRRSRCRRRRRRGHASEPVALRPVLRRPRAVHRPRPRLQRLHHRAVLAVLLTPGPHRPHPPHRRRRRGGRDRAGGGRRVPGHPPAGHAAPALLLTGLRPGVGGGPGQRCPRVHPHPDGRGEGQRPRGRHAQGGHGERRPGQPTGDREVGVQADGHPGHLQHHRPPAGHLPAHRRAECPSVTPTSTSP